MPLRHMDARKVAPDAADHIEPLALTILQDIEPLQRLFDDRLRRLKIVFRLVDDAQRSERQRRAGAEPLAARDTYEFEARAAEIAHHAVGIGNARQYALRRKPRLLGAGHELNLEAAYLFGAGEEFGPVFRVAHGSGRRHDEPPYADLLTQGDEAAHGVERPLDPLGVEPPGARQRPAEAAQHLLVEDEHGTPHRRRVDDEADGIGAEIDDAEPAGRLPAAVQRNPTSL